MFFCHILNPCPAEPGYALPTDLDLHCLPLSIQIYSNNQNQSDWPKISRHGILIYSAGQELSFLQGSVFMEFII